MPLRAVYAAAAVALTLLVPGSATAAGGQRPLDAAVERDLAFAAKELKRTLREVPNESYPRETRAGGRWDTTGASAWTSGFFPGSLWLMYKATGEPMWRTAAKQRQMDIEWQKWNTTTHDIGFMVLTSFGRAYALTGNDRFRKVAVTAAQSLASRYSDAVHAVRSWNQRPGTSTTDFRVIVDTMMNIELLFWAADHGGPAGLRAKALEHALRTASAHVRGDGSTYHLVVFDADTGAIRQRATVQGYSAESTWMRGQAWAVYGFTTAYRETRDERMLDTARRVADFYLAHLPRDMVPYWDANAPGIPNAPRDSSAAAVAASGLLELAQLEPDRVRGDRYLRAAKATLRSLSSRSYLAQGTPSRSILLHGTADKPHGHYDRGLVYGDYYFLEALIRYRKLTRGSARKASRARRAVTPPPRRAAWLAGIGRLR